MLIGFGKGCFIMANTKAVDFAKIKAEEGAPYAKPVQILDNDGNVVNKDLMANFSDDLLEDGLGTCTSRTNHEFLQARSFRILCPNLG